MKFDNETKDQSGDNQSDDNTTVIINAKHDA
jgi:hypothetical protein